jgi:hypothetical protein
MELRALVVFGREARRDQTSDWELISVRPSITRVTHHAWRLPGQYILSRSVWGKRS